ncbi:MAG TPA: OmpH family outer membrane protein [candidate division Zixibacteria bacterium]|nr:OmpH family outer membrane protein [candidate division Zixibacteria bacterium]
MKRKIAIALTLLLGLVALASAQEGLKLGYVDSDRIRFEFKEFATAQSQLDSLIIGSQRQDSILATELEKLQDELVQKAAVLSPAAKADKEKSFEAKQAAYFQFRQATFGQGGKLEQLRMNLSKPILDKVMEAVQRVAKAEGYSFVFSDESVVYAKDGSDLTDKVLADLNKTTSAPSKK